jgi:hypothetical protein
MPATAPVTRRSRSVPASAVVAVALANGEPPVQRHPADAGPARDVGQRRAPEPHVEQAFAGGVEQHVVADPLAGGLVVTLRRHLSHCKRDRADRPYPAWAMDITAIHAPTSGDAVAREPDRRS